MKKNYIYLSIVLALLLSSTALYGLLIPGAYASETANWKAQAVAQDWVNLLIVLPVLITTTYLACKKSISAYFVWLGNLVYLIYSFAIYSFDLHTNTLFIVYVAILGMSTYLLVFSLVNLDYDRIKKQFNPKWTGKGLSNFLLVVAVAFGLLWLKDIMSFMVTGQLSQSAIDAGTTTNPVHVLDLAFFIPAVAISAILLKKHSKFGYVLPFIVLVNTILMGVLVIAISIVFAFMGLGSQIELLIGFCFVVLIALWLLVTSLRQLQKNSSM